MWSLTGVPLPMVTKLLSAIVKNGAEIGNLSLSDKPYHTFGRLPNYDVTLMHPSISCYHTVLQYQPAGMIVCVSGHAATSFTCKMHTHTHPHTHTHAHTHTHTHVHTPTHTLMHRDTCIQTQALMYTHMHSWIVTRELHNTTKLFEFLHLI